MGGVGVGVILSLSGTGRFKIGPSSINSKGSFEVSEVLFNIAYYYYTLLLIRRKQCRCLLGILTFIRVKREKKIILLLLDSILPPLIIRLISLESTPTLDFKIKYLFIPLDSMY